MKSRRNAQKEEKRGQRAVMAGHFDLIHSIVSEPDVVFYNGKASLSVFQTKTLRA